MAWQKKNTAEHREVIDLQTGMHLVPLIEPESGAEHRLQISLGHEACPHCGHVVAKTNLGEIDPHAVVSAEMDALNESHAAQRAYARKHGIPVRAAK